jgi:hypothetical protein
VDDDLTSGTEAQDQVSRETPGAPWGLNPKTGEPYKRDPDVMRRVREARFGGRGGRRTNVRGAAPRGGAPVGKPAPTRKGPSPKYGPTVAKWFVTGTAALMPDPVDQAIMRHQAVDLALIVDKLLAEDPKLLQWVERLRLKFTGGAKGELAGWAMVTGGLVAMNRGYQHPVLALMLGGALEGIKADAIRFEAQRSADRAAMEALFAQAGAEEADLINTYGGTP